MPATTDTTIDLNAEDILIEKQLKEAQERIAYLKAQVAKERKLRLQIKKSGSTSTTTTSNALNKEDQQISAVQSSLEKTLLTLNTLSDVMCEHCTYQRKMLKLHSSILKSTTVSNSSIWPKNMPYIVY